MLSVCSVIDPPSAYSLPLSHAELLASVRGGLGLTLPCDADHFGRLADVASARVCRWWQGGSHRSNPSFLIQCRGDRIRCVEGFFAFHALEAHWDSRCPCTPRNDLPRPPVPERGTGEVDAPGKDLLRALPRLS